MSVELGTAPVKLYLGATPINRIYLGSTIVYGAPDAPATIDAEFITSSTSNTNTITIPSLAQAGDLAIIVDFAANPQPADTTPVGWTKLQTTASSTGLGHRVTAYAKYLVSGDLNTNITGLDSGSEGRVIFIVRAAGTAFAAEGLQAETNITGNPASITLTPAANSHPLLMVAVKYTYGGTAVFEVGTFDVTQSAGNTTTGRLTVGLKRQLADSNSFTFDTDDEGNAQIQAGFYLTLD